MPSNVSIFSGKETFYLSKDVCEIYGSELGKVSVERFSDGEMLVYYNESIRGHDVYIIQSTFPPADNFMELLLMIDAAKRASAESITVIIPYFGYARQDRKDRSRVSMGAKLMANLLQAAGTTRIVTCELHADPIEGFFDIPVVHLQSSRVFRSYIDELKLNDVVFAAPDVGGVKRARGYAKRFKAGPSHLR